MRVLRFMLKGFVRLTLVTILLLPVVARAQVRHDGRFWSGLSRELKVSYIQGVIDGSTVGASLAKEGFSQGDACQDKITPAYSRSAQKFLATVTPAQMVDGVDSVFKDSRNAPVLIADAVYVTLRSITGTTPQDVEKLLEAARTSAK